MPRRTLRFRRRAIPRVRDYGNDINRQTIMNWFFYAAMCAFFYGVEGVYLKYLNRKGIDEGTLTFAMFFYALPFLFIPACLSNQRTFTGNFILYFSLVTVIDGFGYLFYSTSIKNGEVSLVVPVLSLSPVVVMPFSWLLLREMPPAKGVIGMLIIGLGLALLSAGNGAASPKIFFKNRGVRYALLTVLVWGVSANLDKMALKCSGPLVYPFVICAGLAAFCYLFTTRERAFDKKNVPLFFVLGAVNAMLFLTHMLALNTGYVSYLIAVKRSGMLIAVLLGWLFFKEKSPGLKFLASIFIIAGIYMLVR